jgi:hypothetical protein
MRGISTLSDATFAEVEASEQLFRDFDSQAKPYKRLLDVFLSRFFGVKTAIEFLQRYGGNISAINWDKLPRSDQGILDQAASLYKSKRFFHWDLEFPEVFIDLDSASWKDNPGFDAVIGNPPYGSPFNNNEITYFKESYHCISYRVESYVAFMEKTFNFLIELGGVVSLIVPDNWMYLDFTENLRIHFLKNGIIKNIVALPRTVFKSATVDTTIYVIQKTPNSQSHETLVTTFLKKDVINEISNSNTKQLLRNQDYWLSFHEHIINPYLSSSELVILDKINDCSNDLKQITAINYGLKAYQKGKGHPPQTTEVMEIKPFTNNNKVDESYAPFFEGQSIQRYSIDWYHNNWIKWGKWLAEPRNKELFCQDRLLFRKVVDSRLLGCFYQEEAYSNTLLYVVKLKDSVNYNLKSLLAILNSKLTGFVFRKKFAIQEEDTFPQILLDDFASIPIRKISFNTNSDRRQHCLEKLIKSYQEKQEILKEIEEHIRREETDIVHDILAYLAEQMIEINREKQKEIKSFLRYLERIIGSAIDNLTNKSKIQNYLGDYQKSEPHLSLDQLWEILKKNKKKISVNLLDRQIQETLEKEYQTSLDKLLPLKQQLSATDELIDLIVYKLYGLSEEEIKIIEGRE